MMISKYVFEHMLFEYSNNSIINSRSTDLGNNKSKHNAIK